ncbi:MAG: SRPBCC family protein [Phycisphaerales bacterium]
MKPITVSETVNAPQDRVFAICAEIPNCASYIRGIETIETLHEAPPSPDNLGVVGEGYAWRETRIMFGKQATEDMTIINWNPPTSYDVEARSHGAYYLSTITCEPIDAQTTKLTMTFTAKPETFMAKVMMVLFSFMQKKLCQALQEDLEDIKKEAESAS